MGLVLHPFSHFDCIAFTLFTFKVVIDDYIFTSISSLFFGYFCSSYFFFFSSLLSFFVI